MWHRFPTPMRDVILRALEEAGRRGRREAEPGDFIAAMTQATSSADAPKATVANALSTESMRLFEQAYQECAALDERLIGIDHLQLAYAKLNPSHQPTYDALLRDVKRRRRMGIGPEMSKADARVALPGEYAMRLQSVISALANVWKIHIGRSILHPKFVTDPYAMYREIFRKYGPIRRDPFVPA